MVSLWVKSVFVCFRLGHTCVDPEGWGTGGHPQLENHNALGFLSDASPYPL